VIKSDSKDIYCAANIPKLFFTAVIMFDKHMWHYIDCIETVSSLLKLLCFLSAFDFFLSNAELTVLMYNVQCFRDRTKHANKYAIGCPLLTVSLVKLPKM